MQTVVEDTVTTRKMGNALGAYIDAKRRGDDAVKKNAEFFESDTHLDRLGAVADIIKNFFGCLPSYYTPRYGHSRPFEAVKVEAAGYRIARTSSKDKQAKLYGPLENLGDVSFKVSNGHLIIRVYPVTDISNS